MKFELRASYQFDVLRSLSYDIKFVGILLSWLCIVDDGRQLVSLFLQCRKSIWSFVCLFIRSFNFE